MKHPKFNTNEEYWNWYEKEENKRILKEYFATDKQNQQEYK